MESPDTSGLIKEDLNFSPSYLASLEEVKLRPYILPMMIKLRKEIRDLSASEIGSARIVALRKEIVQTTLGEPLTNYLKGLLEV